ncbi:MAG: PilZ domain-containing protein [bacterium]|nr:PilZ domain-containing protein [bacterium]
MSSFTERRAHPRAQIELSVGCCLSDAPGVVVCRGLSRDVSSGGLYFRTNSEALITDALVDVELAVPPGAGHFSYPGTVRGTGKVMRLDDLPPASGGGDESEQSRFGVAAKFHQPLALAFSPTI